MGRDGKSPTVLVVEDSADIRQILRFLLERGGHRVVEAADGHDAVEAARRECPDLVLMNLGLPGLDGVSAMSAIRRIEPLCGVPVIVLSGFDHEHREAALAAGCSAFLQKPVDSDRLESLVRQYLSTDE